MNFTEKYVVTPQYLNSPSSRRSGKSIDPAVKFIVAHDTGNPNSTARQNIKYYENSRNEMSASAHIFLDDKEILECIPALTSPRPEKAWHVLYNVPTDNNLYGFNANDAAIGVEYCYGNNIIADEAYKRYLWVLAKLCFVFKLDPAKSIVGHCILDPKRKTDPVTGLLQSRRTYDQLLRDIPLEYNDCIGGAAPANNFTAMAGTGIVSHSVNIRLGSPTTRASIVHVAGSGEQLPYVGFVDNGESVNGNPKWYKDKDGNYFWSGAVS